MFFGSLEKKQRGFKIKYIIFQFFISTKLFDILNFCEVGKYIVLQVRFSKQYSDDCYSLDFLRNVRILKTGTDHLEPDISFSLGH